ncbi:hypothetical protein J2847_002757 [Azospirillum agricola]|uniref:hypothetical protein n=1 Tax=Azospirillum agricola TaxID=1720247 RepID=UPI001AE29A61|nr:hypothetical protein [Azospirillum agricola]MBP2229458.1 hypothetical protein [Azospirillum agricola]
MPAVSISQLPAGAALAGPEQLPAVQDGATVRTTVADLRAGLAESGHGHGPADIAGLPAALAATRRLGRRSLWLPAAALAAPSTGGAAPGTLETPDHGVVLPTLDFDAETGERAQALVALPKAWDGGALAVQPVWTAGGGSGDVLWSVAGVALGDGEGLDAAAGAPVTVADTLTAADSLHAAGEGAPLVPAGAAVPGGLLVLTVARAAADPADTLDADARLLGLRLLYTVDAASDD